MSTIKVSLIGFKILLCGALSIYRKVDPTIYDLQQVLPYFQPSIRSVYLMQLACKAALAIPDRIPCNPAPTSLRRVRNGAALEVNLAEHRPVGGQVGARLLDYITLHML